MNMPVPSSLMKFHARKALKGHWQTALLVSFSAGILYTIPQVTFLLTAEDLLAQLQAVMMQTQTLDAAFMGIYGSGLGLLTIILFGIAFLLSPVLALGQIVYYSNRMSNQPSQYKDLFSRLNIFFKSLVLNLNISLRTTLWAMIPMVPYIVICFLFINSMSANTLSFLASFTSMCSSVLGLMATLRYFMSTFIMANKPETGINQAIRESKSIMKNKIMQLFTLQLSFVGWRLLIIVGSSTLTVLFGSVISITASLFCNLVLSAYVTATNTVFYLYNTDAIPVINPAKFSRGDNRK